MSILLQGGRAGQVWTASQTRWPRAHPDVRARRALLPTSLRAGLRNLSRTAPATPRVVASLEEGQRPLSSRRSGSGAGQLHPAAGQDDRVRRAAPARACRCRRAAMAGVRGVDRGGAFHVAVGESIRRGWTRGTVVEPITQKLVGAIYGGRWLWGWSREGVRQGVLGEKGRQRALLSALSRHAERAEATGQ